MKHKIIILWIAIFLFPISASSVEWTWQVPTPTNPAGHFTGVWGSSSSDVFAVAQQDGAIFHYNGSAWTYMTSGLADQLNGVWGTSSTDVFVVGYDDKSHGNSPILHYDGTAWSFMANPLTGENIVLYNVWGSSGSDVFAVGNDNSGNGIILHYNGTAWSSMTSGTTPGSVLRDIWGSSSNDVFAVGGQGIILHYNGNAWSAMASGTTQGLGAIWGSSSNDVFVVGGAGTILHYDGSTWTAMTSVTTAPLGSVWGSSSTDVYAVGAYGTILHYNGTNWSIMNSGTTKNLTGIWGNSSSDVFVVGYDGIIGKYVPGGGEDDIQNTRIAALEAQIAQIKQALQNCGCTPQPTTVQLSSLKAIPSDEKVTLNWQTETENDNTGFNIWRAEGFRKINEGLIPALGSPTAGSEYDFVDQWVLNGKRYFYLLEDIDTNGISTFHGPVKAVPRWIYGREINRLK